MQALNYSRVYALPIHIINNKLRSNKILEVQYICWKFTEKLFTYPKRFIIWSSLNKIIRIVNANHVPTHNVQMCTTHALLCFHSFIHMRLLSAWIPDAETSNFCAALISLSILNVWVVTASLLLCQNNVFHFLNTKWVRDKENSMKIQTFLIYWNFGRKLNSRGNSQAKCTMVCRLYQPKNQNENDAICCIPSDGRYWNFCVSSASSSFECFHIRKFQFNPRWSFALTMISYRKAQTIRCRVAVAWCFYVAFVTSSELLGFKSDIIYLIHADRRIQVELEPYFCTHHTILIRFRWCFWFWTVANTKRKWFVALEKVHGTCTRIQPMQWMRA